MSLSLWLKACRQLTGLSKTEVAKRSGLSLGYIWRIESGKQNNPTLEAMNALAAAFNVPVDTLLQACLGKMSFGQIWTLVEPYASSTPAPTDEKF